MKRNYTREDYTATAVKLKLALPALKLSTDIMVGFPGETDEDFGETMRLVREIEFSLAFCFKYSPRAGTASYFLKDDVPQAVKEERLSRLLQIFKSGNEKTACSAA